MERLRQGWRVVAVGSSVARGAALVAEAGTDRLVFEPADLSSMAETTALGERLAARHLTIDALVLGAFRYEPVRRETADGLERTFALSVMSRYLLAGARLPALARAPRPVIVNMSGVGGIRAGALHWDDLQFTPRIPRRRCHHAGRAGQRSAGHGVRRRARRRRGALHAVQPAVRRPAWPSRSGRRSDNWSS
jgi:hypothetical protein